ncbi:hypothetical protein GP486_003790 [Trichoglossum hirsutum]|uniref:Heterokaryon incompatibility domain-containing protein n=1 Tax=Trichoglossum hirsutum TaxID=265104 RepID=A0A9P8RQ61_9PEZI|nr:hypothetical protein GP486_003790 [Trichoglossum hirsutum]
MAVPLGQTYEYSPLPSKTSIRLLQILSRAEEPIRCSLEVVDLNDEPLYDCLSYTWGDPLYHELSGPENTRRTTGERNNAITCDGLVLCITENLREALLQLSRNASSSTAGHDQYQRQRFIWIDAVCIDQGNLSERSSQVAMMNSIYKAAQTVVIWLGIDDVHTKRAIDVMNRLSSIPPEKLGVELPSNLDDPEMYSALGIPYIEPQQWLDYAAFLQRSWFSRVWVIQEIFVARNVVVFCGSNVLLWSDISASSQVLRETQLGELLTGTVVSAVSPSASTAYVGNTLTNPFIFENMRVKATSLNLEKLLADGRYFNATDDRDRVFALLGMREQPPVHTVPYDIRPEYHTNVQRVYTKASWATIYEMEDLNLLSLVEDASFRKLQDLPSWVPDYSVAPQTHPLTGNPRVAVGEERWNASGGLKWEVPAQMDLLLLPVEGIRFSTIIEFAATAAEITDLYQMKTLLDLLVHYPQPRYPDGGTPIEAFWKTLIKDTFHGQPAGKEARRSFALFIALRVWELKEALENLRDTIEYSEPKPGPLDPLSVDFAQLSNVYDQTKAAISVLSTKGMDGVIPDWKAIEHLIEIGQGEASPEKDDLDRDSDHIAESFRVAYNGRRLFSTEGNYLGIAAQSLQKGDTIWVLAGAAVPVVLRPLPNGNWKLVGEAYVHGIMNGEAVRGDDIKPERIQLE